MKREYSFPYVAESPAEWPEGFQQPVGQFLKPNDPAHLILVFPRHTQTKLENQRSVAPQALLFTASGLLHVQQGATPAQPPAVTYLRGADLLYAQHTLILLYGRLELGGVIDGRLARIVVEYNTVRLHLLQPPLQQFLRLAYGTQPSEPHSDGPTETLLAGLRARSYKLYAALRLDALLPDEQLQGFVFQPRIMQRLGFGLGRPIAPAAVLALTDRAVILMEEDKPRGAVYGWHITFCPRACVTSIEIQPQQEWREVCVRLERSQVTSDRHLTLDNDTAQAWQALWLDQGQSKDKTY